GAWCRSNAEHVRRDHSGQPYWLPVHPVRHGLAARSAESASRAVDAVPKAHPMSSIPALLFSIVTLLSPSAMHQDFISCGFQPNSPFASTNGTFAVLDPAEASAVDRRVMMVAVFPDEATAQTARERGTHLFAGYGPAVWRSTR